MIDQARTGKNSPTRKQQRNKPIHFANQNPFWKSNGTSIGHLVAVRLRKKTQKEKDFHKNKKGRLHSQCYRKTGRVLASPTSWDTGESKSCIDQYDSIKTAGESDHERWEPLGSQEERVRTRTETEPAAAIMNVANGERGPSDDNLLTQHPGDEIQGMEPCTWPGQSGLRRTQPRK